MSAPPASAGGVDVLRGAAADAWLQSPAAAACWDALLQGCDWATVFQSPAFIRAWYRAYATRVEPVILLAPRGSPAPASIMFAGILDGAPVLAGARQAEYPAWLGGAGTDFAKVALGELCRLANAASLRIRYLPEGLPATIHRGHPLWSHCVVTSHVMPLMAPIGAAALDGTSLRKFKRLTKVLGGEPELRFAMDPPAVRRLLADALPHYELRQLAQHGLAPFAADPLKLVFHEDLAGSAPAGLCGIALYSRGSLVAAVLGPASRGILHVALVAHDPRHHRDSPVRVMLKLAMRGDVAARNGLRGVDLTPGDAWKEELASDCRQVMEVEFFQSRLQAAINRRWRAARASLAALWKSARPMLTRVRGAMAPREPREGTAPVAVASMAAVRREACRGAASPDCLGFQDWMACVAKAQSQAMATLTAETLRPRHEVVGARVGASVVFAWLAPAEGAAGHVDVVAAFQFGDAGRVAQFDAWDSPAGRALLVAMGAGDARDDGPARVAPGHGGVPA